MISEVEREYILNRWGGREHGDELYLVLLTGPPGVNGTAANEVANGTGYGRTILGFTQPTILPGLDGSQIANNMEVTMPTPTAPWGTVTHIAISLSNVHGGEVYIGAELDVPLNVATGTAVTFPVGSLKFVIYADQQV